MKALILAAGYATRLYPLTKKYPKPLLEVGGRPIIDYIVDKLSAVAGVNEIYVVTNSKFIAAFRKWKRSVKPAKKVTLVNDLTTDNRDRLGAIGDINFVAKRKKLQDDLLVIGGDNLFSGKLDGFLDFSKSHAPDVSIGLYRLKHKKDASRYGVATLDRQKKITSFQEKPKSPRSDLVAMCLYYIPRKSLPLIHVYLQGEVRRADATGSYVAWLKDRTDVFGYVFGGAWFDIGDFKYLNSAKEKFI